MIPENTAARDPLLLAHVICNPAASIEQMEAAGQRQLVHSDVLPADGDTDALAAAGFVLGDLVDGDPLFRHVTMPDGWTKQPSDHSMWSYVLDRHGRRRVAVFYKASWYDRRAMFRMCTVEDYVSELVDGPEDLVPVFDDGWCSRDVFARAALEYAAERDRYADVFVREGEQKLADEECTAAVRARRLAAKAVPA